MEVLAITELSSGDHQVDLELTEDERQMIREEYGWKRLTNKRIQQWFLNTVQNTIDSKNEK